MKDIFRRQETFILWQISAILYAIANSRTWFDVLTIWTARGFILWYIMLILVEVIDFVFTSWRNNE